MRLIALFSTLTAILSAASIAAAQELAVIGAPVDGATGFQPAVTELARDLQWLKEQHDPAREAEALMKAWQTVS